MFFCKQKTAYEMRIRDWRSDVCASDLAEHPPGQARQHCRYGLLLRDQEKSAHPDGKAAVPEIRSGGAEARCLQGRQDQVGCAAYKARESCAKNGAVTTLIAQAGEVSEDRKSVEKGTRVIERVYLGCTRT